MTRHVGRRRVVVTGAGMVTPLARGVAGTFERAARGESGISPLTAFDGAGLPCAIAGQVDDRWLGGTPAPTRPSLSTRALELALVAADEAALSSRLAEVLDRSRIGLVLGGHGRNPTPAELARLQACRDDAGAWDHRALVAAGAPDLYQFLRRKPDHAAAALAGRLAARGPVLAVASACAAGAQAIGEATLLVRDGFCDVAVAGGCEATLDPVGFLGFVLLRALVERCESPETASCPFDRRRNGFVLSEGAAIVVLEEREHAIRRGAPVLGEILGYGDSSDAHRMTDPRPDGAGAVLAMRRALDDAGLAPDAVEYVNAHGTSTVQGDLAEARAIREVLREGADHVPVSSNKSMLGHTIAAAGAIECVLTLEGLRRSLALPTINQRSPDPRCDLDVVPNRARLLEHRVALSNSFGFGGQNACLCLGRTDG